MQSPFTLLFPGLVHRGFLCCRIESASRYFIAQLAPAEIHGTAAADRLAPAGDDEDLIASRVLRQLVRLDEGPVNLMHVLVLATRPAAKLDVPPAAVSAAIGLQPTMVRQRATGRYAANVGGRQPSARSRREACLADRRLVPWVLILALRRLLGAASQ
jgi:hypothetical protein